MRVTSIYFFHLLVLINIFTLPCLLVIKGLLDGEGITNKCISIQRLLMNTGQPGTGLVLFFKYKEIE